MAYGRKTGGRKAGTPNKVSRQVKDNILEVFELTGGREAMAEWAAKEANRAEFYRLYAKLLPTEISGPDGDAVGVRLVIQS